MASARSPCSESSLFHAGVAALSGGYVGVDVFFVISGFLIATMLVEGSRTDDSRSRFYVRRIRRILPALVATILLCCAAILAFSLIPDALYDFGAASSRRRSSLSNICFWKNTGYFEAGALDRPCSTPGRSRSRSSSTLSSRSRCS